MFTVIVAVTSVVLSIFQSFRLTGPGTIYVGGGTSFFRDGSSPGRAFKSIQQALQWAVPGDRILIHDGIYRERLQLKSAAASAEAITIEAVHPGQVTVDWGIPLWNAIAGAWQDEGDGIISAVSRWPIYRVHLGDQCLFREVYGGLEHLRTLIRRPNAFAAFYWDHDRLYIWLPSRDLPRFKELTTHHRAPRPREWGEFRSANFVVNDSSVILRGLRFCMGIGSSVRVLGRSRLIIEDCSFSGANFGIQFDQSCSAAGQVEARRCLYHNYPQHNWRRSWLNWEEIYVGHASSSFISSSAPLLEIEDSVAVHVGDGFRVSNDPGTVNPDAQLRGNIVAFGTDDAFEIEGSAMNIGIERNLVLECHESLGLSPVEIGPVKIRRNLFLHEPNGTNGAQVKLINRLHSDQQIQNIQILENIFVGNWLCWMSGEVVNVRVENNLFDVERQANPRWPAGTSDRDNQYLDRRVQSIHSESLSAGISGLNRRLKQLPQNALPNEVIDEALIHHAGPSWWNWSNMATQDLSHYLTVLRSQR